MRAPVQPESAIGNFCVLSEHGECAAQWASEASWHLARTRKTGRKSVDEEQNI
jgi:hypothetical protein